MPIVTLLNNNSFVARGEETLLNEAKMQGLLLEHSCRTGRCGVCKVQVLHGETRPINSEVSLTQQDLDKGCILTCCRIAVTDVELATEDLGRLATIKTKTLPCRISELNALAPDVVRVLLRVPPKNPLDYVPGQYVDIIGKNGIRRSYSIANARRDDEHLELHIRKVPGGVMSEYWFNSSSLNDLLRLEGPLGTFSYRDTDAEYLVFLATGTGIAPVKAILEDFSRNPGAVRAKKILAYWGGRSEVDFYQKLDFPSLNLMFTPVLSRIACGWTGRVGYVQNCLIEDGVDLKNAAVYACGSDVMIKSAKELLLNSGLAECRFYSDAFVSSS